MENEWRQNCEKPSLEILWQYEKENGGRRKATAAEFDKSRST